MLVFERICSRNETVGCMACGWSADFDTLVQGHKWQYRVCSPGRAFMRRTVAYGVSTSLSSLFFETLVNSPALNSFQWPSRRGRQGSACNEARAGGVNIRLASVTSKLFKASRT